MQGHRRNECQTNPYTSSQQPRVQTQGQAQGQIPAPAQTTQPNVNVCSMLTANPSTYITVSLDGKAQFCLLDTGCDFSLIPHRLVSKYVLLNSDTKVYAANGNKLNVLGKLEVEFMIKNLKLRTQILVSDDIHDFMLGYDFLSAQKAVWDFEQNSLTIKGVTIPLETREKRATCCRIYAVEDTQIPPNTEMNVPVKLVHHSVRSLKTDWLVTPKALANNVYMARVLLPDESDRAAIRVLNISDKPFVLNSKNLVGNAIAAETVEDKTAINSFCNTVADKVVTDYSFLQPVFGSLPDDLDPRERSNIIDFLKDYQDIFSRHEYDLGRTDLLTHHIDTGDAKPFRQPLRRHPQKYLEVIDEATDKMLGGDIIEPACSPWASNVVVVSKQDKTPRITLDYRQLNTVSRKDSYPLPNTAECLDAFRGAAYFSALDLRSSFYQVPLADEDRDKTAFITRRGQFRFKCLPMGLCNSPGTFQRLMDLVLRGLTWSSVLVYIDDIVVFANSPSELRKRLEEVFVRLRKANLKLKPSKVKLFQKEITFLGHKISAQGVAMDESKIAEIVNWPAPRNLLQVKQFLGMAGYYRRYVKDYAKHSSPLNELNRKEEPFVWTDKRQSAFNYLKNCLVTAPILAMSRDEGKFVLDVDASDYAVGVVLQQEQDDLLRVIGYSSRSFNKHEKNYCITRKELAAIIFGLQQYRQYLLGRNFVIRSDHAALTYLLTTKNPIGQQARWMDFMSEFTFEIVHRAGVSHGNADSLSRKSPCDTGGIRCKQCHRGEVDIEDEPDIGVGLCAVVTTRAQQRCADNEFDSVTNSIQISRS